MAFHLLKRTEGGKNLVKPLMNLRKYSKLHRGETLQKKLCVISVQMKNEAKTICVVEPTDVLAMKNLVALKANILY